MQKFRCLRCFVLTLGLLCPDCKARLFKGVDPLLLESKPPEGPWQPS